MIGIYKITNPSGKIYIGQSVDLERRKNHYFLNCCKDQPALYNSIQKYKFENHLFEVIEECEMADLNTRERYWQEFYNSVENGLNCKYVHTFEKSGILSDETKNKISKSSLGNKKWLGRTHSEETKIKIGLANKGKRKGCIISEKQRREHSLAMRGANNYKSVIVINTENGIFYDCIQDASVAHNIPATTLRNKLSGYRRNNTPLKYA